MCDNWQWQKGQIYHNKKSENDLLKPSSVLFHYTNCSWSTNKITMQKNIPKAKIVQIECDWRSPSNIEIGLCITVTFVLHVYDEKYCKFNGILEQTLLINISSFITGTFHVISEALSVTKWSRTINAVCVN